MSRIYMYVLYMFYVMYITCYIIHYIFQWLINVTLHIIDFQLSYCYNHNLSIKDALIVVLKLPCNYKVAISNSK